MPYTHRKVGDKECVYKKDGGAKVGCTKGSVDKYLAALHANVDESVDICNGFDYGILAKSITETNTIKGGKSDKLSLKDIADKFDVSLGEIKSQLQKGIKVETEHTNDKEKATEIATDHISEFPDYYDRLEKMENKADKETKTKEMNENTKILIKRLLRENIEEGPLGRALGTAAMAASTLMSPKVQASAPKPPIEMTSEKLGVIKNVDGSFTSTVQTDGPTKEIAKQLAIEKAKNQILYKLDSPKGSVVNVKVMDVKTKKLDNGTFMCLITITANLE
jgi:hypothetical protein